MAESHPARFDDRSALGFAQLARNTVASFTLLACLISLSIILHNQYGVRHFSTVIDGLGAIDLGLTEPANAPESIPDRIDPNEGKYRSLGEYLARRYRVSSEMATQIVANAHAAGSDLKIDPMLILAVISVESRFNPIAQSVSGAKGLMQVIPRFHGEKFDPLGGEKVAFDPTANIIVGAKILKEYIRRTGDLADALQMYVGATSEDSENGYSVKVIAERDRLQHVVRQYLSQNRTARPHAPAKSHGLSS
ncbi:MAG TPA: lytic transglycosylase domain-containing protein [Burkholderiales bacterium]|nr:lytic transglycosylase domain-containing protein [Burkholderiales bacterium]